MKIWLDDIRNPEQNYIEGYIWVKTYVEAIRLLETGKVEEISLDHDLGYTDPNHTGYDVVKWIEEAVITRGFKPPEMFCHSWNPVGRNT